MVASRGGGKGKNGGPPPQKSWLLMFLGIILIPVAAYVVYYQVSHYLESGRIVNPLDVEEQKRIAQMAARDGIKALEETRDWAAKARVEMNELLKELNGVVTMKLLDIADAGGKLPPERRARKTSGEHRRIAAGDGRQTVGTDAVGGKTGSPSSETGSKAGSSARGGTVDAGVTGTGNASSPAQDGSRGTGAKAEALSPKEVPSTQPRAATKDETGKGAVSERKAGEIARKEVPEPSAAGGADRPSRETEKSAAAKPEAAVEKSAGSPAVLPRTVAEPASETPAGEGEKERAGDGDVANAPSSKGEERGEVPEKAEPRKRGSYEKAMEIYQETLSHYRLTRPGNPPDQIQRELKYSEKKFREILELLAQARREDPRDERIDPMEEQCQMFLYDCLKRQVVAIR
jgi:hypothetical protein